MLDLDKPITTMPQTTPDPRYVIRESCVRRGKFFVQDNNTFTMFRHPQLGKHMTKLAAEETVKLLMQEDGAAPTMMDAFTRLRPQRNVQALRSSSFPETDWWFIRDSRTGRLVPRVEGSEEPRDRYYPDEASAVTAAAEMNLGVSDD